MQRGYFGIWDMRIYCRGVEIVFVLRIYIALPFFVRAVDGPQLAWEHSAHIPLSGRYHPLSSRSLRPFCTTRRAAYFFVRAHYSCIFLSCAYSVAIITNARTIQYMNATNNVIWDTIAITCNTVILSDLLFN